MTTIADYYKNHVNNRWPQEASMRDMTAEEAVRAAKRLYRYILKRPWKGPVKVVKATVRGRYHTWIHRGVLRVVPLNGWRDLVHDLSHYCYGRLHPGAKPHDRPHGAMEARMIDYVVQHGWLAGKLRPKPKLVALPVGAVLVDAKANARAYKRARAEAAVERWQSKLKRAERALRKARRRLAYYSRSGAPRGKPADATGPGLGLAGIPGA